MFFMLSYVFDNAIQDILSDYGRWWILEATQYQWEKNQKRLIIYDKGKDKGFKEEKEVPSYRNGSDKCDDDMLKRLLKLVNQ